MPKTGKVAFSVILGLAALTGVLAFMLFSWAAPGPIFSSAALDPTLFSGSPTDGMGGGGEESTTTSGAGANSTGQNQTAAIPANAVTISILEGSSVQGNPSYDPETAEVGIDQTVAWKNDDSVPHTATSEGLFDSSILNSGDTFSIAAEEIGAGEHNYICTIHPYMKGQIVVK